MTTEEMIEEMKPLTLELDYADEAVEREQVEAAQAETTEVETGEQRTKKEQIVSLFESGTRDIAEIVRRVKARPSYVAQVLQHAGHLDGYFDLYTTTGREQNVYTRYFRNVLHFRNVEAARESVARIDRLYNYFERLGDRAGQHQAMILALTGKNRARWSGKAEESQVFSDWLAAH
jgi:actin-related protein